MTKPILFLAIITTNAFAVSEHNFSIIYQEHTTQNNFELKYYRGVNNHKVDYLKYGNSNGERGVLIIAVGRNEASLKYLEVAYDLYQLGFSPIYITSHRGQGFSDRELKNRDKGYVKKFSYYTQDLKTLREIAYKETHGRKMYLIGHSMGGAIATDYLHTHPNDFDKAILVSPMLKIKLDEGEIPTLLKTYAVCSPLRKNGCTQYVPGGRDANPNPKFENSDVTSSRVRFNWREYLYKVDNRTRIGSATFKWVQEAIKANLYMRRERNVNKMKTPFLILQAGNELVVDPRGSSQLCQQTKLCTLATVKGSMHNILTETDNYRDQALNLINVFLN